MGSTETYMTPFDTNTKAATVLEMVSDNLIDADVDYQCGDGIHHFIALFDRVEYRVGFPDDILERRSVEELATVALDIFDRARTGTLHIRVVVRQGAFQDTVN
jgi:hypothetical protein